MSLSKSKKDDCVQSILPSGPGFDPSESRVLTSLLQRQAEQTFPWRELYSLDSPESNPGLLAASHHQRKKDLRQQATLPKDSFKNLADRRGNGGCVTRKLPGCVACPINKCLVHPRLYFLVLSKMQELKGKRVSGEALSEITKANLFNQVVAAAHCSPSRHIQGAVIAFAVLTVPRRLPLLHAQ